MCLAARSAPATLRPASPRSHAAQGSQVLTSPRPLPATSSFCRSLYSCFSMCRPPVHVTPNTLSSSFPDVRILLVSCIMCVSFLPIFLLYVLGFPFTPLFITVSFDSSVRFSLPMRPSHRNSNGAAINWNDKQETRFQVRDRGQGGSGPGSPRGSSAYLRVHPRGCSV